LCAELIVTIDSLTTLNTLACWTAKYRHPSSVSVINS